MAATNIFYRIPSQRGTRVATIAGSECTLHQFCDYIIESEGLSRSDFIVASGTKVFRPDSYSLQSISLQNNSHVDILIPLLGGKGGFGSLLRAIGAQIEKTTNRDACRDLSGRRLRDVKREEELRKLLALQEKLEEEKKRRKQEKLDKLKKRSEASTTSASIQELVAMFNDHEYNKRRLELGDIIEAAVDKGLINFKRRQQEEMELMDKSKRARLEDQDSDKSSEESKRDESECSDNPAQTLGDEMMSRDQSISAIDKPVEKRNKVKKEDLWLGLDDDDSVEGALV